MIKHNPCDECIINMMCEDHCEELIKYLEETLLPNHGPADPKLFPYIAKQLRLKQLRLVEGNKKISFEATYYD